MTKPSVSNIVLVSATCVMIIASAVSSGCQSEPEEETITPAGATGGSGGGSTEAGVGGSGGGSADGGSGGANSGGSGGGNSGGSGGSNSGGSGGGNTGGSGGGDGGMGGSHTGGSGGGGSASCPVGQDRTVQDLATGAVGVDIQVQLTSVVATTKKLLMVKSNNTGSCLWGVFVKDATQPFGTMIINYGDKAPTEGDGFGDCPVGTDLIPDGLVPGDVLSIRGVTDAYSPSTCTNNPVKQTQVKACEVIKVSGGPAPEPVLVANPADIKAGKAELQGLLVKIENVDAQDWPDGGTVGPYGVIKLQGSGLEVHDKFYYKDAVGGGAPQFDNSQQFTSITGIVHLDYCDWSLQARDKCNDFDPPSKDCP